MMTTTWTPEQKAMLHSDMTNEEIAEKVGRSVSAVRDRRYCYTGHTTNITNWKAASADTKRRTYGEVHVIATARRIGAKILDVR
jgi:hypothetical protein